MSEQLQADLTCDCMAMVFCGGVFVFLCWGGRFVGAEALLNTHLP